MALSSQRLRPVVVSALVLGVGMGAVLGVLTAGAEPLDASLVDPPGLDRLLSEIPPHPGAYFFPLGESLHVDGQPRQMAHALADDPLHNVGDRYEGIWTSRGLKVKRQDSDLESWLIATDPTDPFIRSVVLRTRPDGKTVIIASFSEKFAEQQTNAVLPQGCDVVSSTGAQDGSVATEIVFANCPLALADVLDFYDGRFKKKHTFVEPTAAAPDVHAQYTGADRSLMLAGTRVSTAPPRSVLSLTWQYETQGETGGDSK